MVRLDGFLFLKYEIIMRINTKFKLRDIAGETIIVNQGTPEADLTRIISLNTSARLLWNELSDKDFLTSNPQLSSSASFLRLNVLSSLN